MSAILDKADEILSGTFMATSKISQADSMCGVMPKGEYGATDFEDTMLLARPERFELPTNWFEASYSIQLSYGRVVGKYSAVVNAPEIR